MNSVAGYFFFLLGLLFAIIGGGIIVFRPSVYKRLVHNELILKPNSKMGREWRENAYPIHMSLYLFDWINAKEVIESKWEKKIQLVQKGPYVFEELIEKTNVKWYGNTVMYNQRKSWIFQDGLSNGSLSDTLTILNPTVPLSTMILNAFSPITATLVNAVCGDCNDDMLIMRKSVGEILFTGYKTPLDEILADTDIPGLKDGLDFAWFKYKNATLFDGLFEMYTGLDNLDLRGKLKSWHSNPFYNEVSLPFVKPTETRGFTGELFPPLLDEPDTLPLFAPDMCSTLDLEYAGMEHVSGIDGRVYRANTNSLRKKRKTPIGLTNLVEDKYVFFKGLRRYKTLLSKFELPVYFSFPHFHNGDPKLFDHFDSFQSNQSTNQMYVTVEPLTGTPLEFNNWMQVNLLIQPVEGVRIYENLKKLYMPQFWLVEHAKITGPFVEPLRNLHKNYNYVLYTSIGCLITGCVFATIAGVLLATRKRTESYKF